MSAASTRFPLHRGCVLDSARACSERASNCATNAATSTPARARRCSSGCWRAPSFSAFETAGASRAVPRTSPIGSSRDCSRSAPTPSSSSGPIACLLGRPADEGGLRHYAAAIAAGDRRRSGASARSACRKSSSAAIAIWRRKAASCCATCSCASWPIRRNGTTRSGSTILRSLGLSDDKLSMHRKPYEFTQLLFGCRRLGALREDSSVISVGAGHELVLYWLANHVRRMIATDMYEGVWQDVQGREGDPDVINRPDEYAPFPVPARSSHLHEDGRPAARLPGSHLRHRLLAFLDRAFRRRRQARRRPFVKWAVS